MAGGPLLASGRPRPAKRAQVRPRAADPFPGRCRHPGNRASLPGAAGQYPHADRTDREAARVATWAMAAGVAGFACASARAEVLPGPTVPAGLVAQAGAGAEFRAHRPVRLASTTDGPTSEAPLSFGRRQPTPAATATAAPSATPAPAPASGPSSMNPAKKPVASEPAAPTAPEASAGSPAPANIATPSATRPANDAALRDEEARALARLRARLEETLKQHSGIDARVKARRDGLRVVSHGPAEPSPQDVASAVRNPAAARAAAQARRYASVSPARPDRKSTRLNSSHVKSSYA